MRLSLAQKVTLPLLSFGGQLDALEYLKSLGDWAALWDLQEKATYGAELYVTANAASDPAGNEADATTGWTAAVTTLTSDSAIKSVGDYSIKSVFLGGGSASYFDLNTILTVGKRYKINFNSRHLGSGGDTSVALGSAPGGFDVPLALLTNTDITFVAYPSEFVHSATTRYLSCREDSLTDDGGVYLDNISITEVTNESGLVALAYNNEIPVGRQLVQNPNFANWTGVAPADSPDDWTTVQAGDATSNVTQNPAGQCQIISTGPLTSIAQIILSTGKTYTLTIDIKTVANGSVRIWGGTLGSGDNVIYNTTGVKTFNFTASNTTLTIARGTGADDVTFDIVTCQQTGILDSSAYPGAELLAGTEAADFTEGNSAVLTDQAGGVVRIARNGAVNNPYAFQSVVTIGQRIKLFVEIRTDANATIRIADGAVQLAAVAGSTSWQEFDIEYVATAVNPLIQAITSTGTEYIEMRNMSLTPANPFNGDNDGATVNQPLQPGIVAYSFDSVNDEVVVKSAELNSGITPLAGTMVALFKIGTAVWEDSTIRTLFRIYVDATNYITMKKGDSVGEVIASYAGEGAAAVDIAHSTLSPLGTMSMIITFDIVANELKMYLQGTQHGATGAITAVMLGNITSAVIGSTGAGEYWDELAAHVGFMRRLMTDAEIATYTGMLNLESGTAFDAGFDEGFI